MHQNVEQYINLRFAKRQKKIEKQIGLLCKVSCNSKRQEGSEVTHLTGKYRLEVRNNPMVSLLRIEADGTCYAMVNGTVIQFESLTAYGEYVESIDDDSSNNC